MASRLGVLLYMTIWCTGTSGYMGRRGLPRAGGNATSSISSRREFSHRQPTRSITGHELGQCLNSLLRSEARILTLVVLFHWYLPSPTFNTIGLGVDTLRTWACGCLTTACTCPYHVVHWVNAQSWPASILFHSVGTYPEGACDSQARAGLVGPASRSH